MHFRPGEQDGLRLPQDVHARIPEAQWLCWHYGNPKPCETPQAIEVVASCVNRTHEDVNRAKQSHKGVIRYPLPNPLPSYRRGYRRWISQTSNGMCSRLSPPATPRRPDGRGRPWRDPRAVLNGILWILRTGASWKDLPERYPPYQTCHRRFQHWVRSGVFEQTLQAFVSDLRKRGELDLSECFIDGTFIVANKGSPGEQDQAGQGYEGHGHGRPC